jgi:predicted dithiol-disulfide oxidoreductase (DUF899 family)
MLSYSVRRERCMAADDKQAAAHRVVSRAEWLTERTALLALEKAFSRQREDLARQRRALPWVRVDKHYVFDTAAGRQSLPELFGSQHQLIVYHFMFKPEAAAGCAHCSFWADHYSGMVPHLRHRDVSFVAVSRAPLPKLLAFRERMGWSFNWVSSGDTDFNYDYQASFTPAELASGAVRYNYAMAPAGPADREGISVFFRDGAGVVYHTYSCYARGIDMMNGTYQFLDLVPRGRDELPGKAQDWVRYHDRY